MKKDKRFWYRKSGGLWHAVYTPIKGYGLVTLCQLKLRTPTNVVGAMDGTWTQQEKRCGNCRRFLKI